MKPTPEQLAALIEGVRRYVEDEISFYELKDLVDQVEAAKPLFEKKMTREITEVRIDWGRSALIVGRKRRTLS